MITLQRQFAVIAMLVALLIGYFTLGPITARPVLTRDPQVERFLAYLLLGFCAAGAIRRRPWTIAVLVVFLAIGLEFCQLFVPGRDAHVRDALAKAAGGVVGVIGFQILVKAQRLIAGSPGVDR